jgi:hypothetical protein
LLTTLHRTNLKMSDSKFGMYDFSLHVYSTPMTSPRDSALMSTAIPVLHLFPQHLVGILRGRQRGIVLDVTSSIHSTSLKDHVALLAVNGDVPEDGLCGLYLHCQKICQLTGRHRPRPLTLHFLPCQTSKKGKRVAAMKAIKTAQFLLTFHH